MVHTMINEKVISFRKEYWTSHFPIEGRYYQFGLFGPSRTLTSQLISTEQELRHFQEEASKREQTHEWSFIAYYGPDVYA